MSSAFTLNPRKTVAAGVMPHLPLCVQREFSSARIEKSCIFILERVFDAVRIVPQPCTGQRGYVWYTAIMRC